MLLPSSVRRQVIGVFVLLLALRAAIGAGEEAGLDQYDFEWVDRPVPFLSKSKNLSEIVLEPEGLEFLRKIKTPVSIVTFIGMSRSGKSFSIDHLLGIDPHKGFKVGHTINPETRGAELWGRPINMKFLASKQNRTSILILDTEGLGASLSNYDKSILFFSVLMSSRVVYHLNENINNDDITRLYSIINLVEMFKKEKIPTINLPYISWVVQRFTLGLPQGYTALDVLFEKKLIELPNPSNDDGISHFNETVRVVRSEFKEHSAFFIPPAAKNINDFTRLPDMKISELNPEYRAKMSELRDLIMSTQPRRLGNTEEVMTGEMLADFITGLIPDVNRGTLYIGDRVLEGIARGLLDKCKRKYEQEMEKIVLPLDISEFETYNLAAKEVARRCFDDGMVGRSDSYVKALYKTMLEDENQLSYDFLKESNTLKSMELCVDVTKLINDKAMKSERTGTTHDSYIEELVKEASGMLRGPKKTICLKDIRSNIIEILNNKKISLIPSRIDTLIKNIIVVVGILYVIKSYSKSRTLDLLIWPLGILGVLLGLYKFNFFSMLTREHVLTILDTYDEAYYVVTTYWQVAPLALVFLLVFAYSFEPKNSRKVANILKGRISKNVSDSNVHVEFWRNCSSDGNAVREVAKKLVLRDKVVVLIGWRHRLGLGFLPRNGYAHIVCSGGMNVKDLVKEAFENAKDVIAEDASDDTYDTRESKGQCMVYEYNVKVSASFFSSDADIKKEIEGRSSE